MTPDLERDRRDLGDDAWVVLREHFVDDDEGVMERLRDSLPLGGQTIRIAGREVASPRLVSWHGEPGTFYTYSGRTFTPNPWTADLLDIKSRIDRAVGAGFNSVLVNYYRDGRDSMGEHADDEPELGPSRDNVLIASVSLGAHRRFVLRHRRTGAVNEYSLGGGSLLVMGGTTQRHWRHRVPRTSLPVAPRMNLTFRVVIEGFGPR